MNGIRPKFLEGMALPKEYFETPDPYKNPSPSKFNIRMMAKYAEQNNKSILDLTWEEVLPFVVMSE